MPKDFKRTAIRLLGFCPEVSQGLPNFDLVSTATGTTTTITVSTAGAGQNANLAGLAANFFNDLYVYFKNNTTTAALRGVFRKISATAFSSPTMTLTVATLPAAPVNGDSFILFAPLQASNPSMTAGYENLERDAFERLTLDPPSSNKGLKVASGSFDLEVFGIESGTAQDRLSQFLKAIGSRSAPVATTVSGGSSTTTSVDVTSEAGISVNDLVLINGEVRLVSAVTAGNITVAPALSSAPANTNAVLRGERFLPYDDGHPSHTILHFRDTQLLAMMGCVFTASLEASFAQNTKLSLSFEGSDWSLTDDVNLDGIQTAKKTIPYVVGETFFGSTELCTNSFNFDLAQGFSTLRDSCAGQLKFVTSRAASLGVVFRNKDATPKNTWEAQGTVQALFAYVGNAANNAFAVSGYAQIQDPSEMTDVEGHEHYDASFGFRDDQDQDEARKPTFFRF